MLAMNKFAVDKLDKLSLVAIVVLTICGLSLAVWEKNKPVPVDSVEAARQEAAARRQFDPNFTQKIALVKKLIIAGNIDNAESLVDELIAAYKYEGMVYMLKGDISLRRQETIKAVIAYRQAVDLNPDFLDKKAADFQGKKIKRTVEEAMVQVEEALKGGAVEEEVKENRDVIYYMLRKIAGSCS